MKYFSENSDFNFLKIQLLTHFTQNVSKLDVLEPLSTDIQEWSHMRLLKDSYWSSNKNQSFILQVLNYDFCQVTFAVCQCNMVIL